MNSMPADVDVNAQRHHRDTLGAIRRIVIINNSAYRSAQQSGCVPAHLCGVCALHVYERIWICDEEVYIDVCGVKWSH